MSLLRDSLLMVQSNLAISNTQVKQNWFTVAKVRYIGTFIKANQLKGKLIHFDIEGFVISRGRYSRV